MPAWATDGLPYSGIPRNVADWTDFCTRSVQRYKTSIRAWGFWNEPNLSGSWSGTRQQFIDIILKPGADAVHAADPGTIVAGPDLAHLESGGALWYSWLADIIQQMGGRPDEETGVRRLSKLHSGRRCGPSGSRAAEVGHSGHGVLERAGPGDDLAVGRHDLQPRHDAQSNILGRVPRRA
jgi:hypothetical protein